MAGKLFKLLLLLLVVAFSYLYFKPTPVQPQKWTPPTAPVLEGKLAPNELLKNIMMCETGSHPGPEDVAVDSAGRIYVGTADGKILRFDAEGKNMRVFADTKGRPLGLDFDAKGNLLVADSDKGLLSVDASGKVTFLTISADDLHFRFTDDVEVARDGKIYFSDASSRFSVHDYKLDLIENRPNGRLLCYDPATGTTTTLLDSLYFANGVALSPNEEYILVNETSRYSVVKYWLSGPNAGQREVFTDNLPGFPDGITLGSNGIFWLTLASPRDPSLDMLMPYPALRKMVANLPPAVQPKPKKYGIVLGLNEKGEIVHNLQDPDGGFTPITSAEEYHGKLYLGNLTENVFATYSLE